MPSTSATDDSYYFSYNTGPVHVISIGSFFADGFGPGSPVTPWVTADLAAVDKAVTPWICIEVHAPWFNSNSQHVNDGRPMRLAYETLFNNAGVAIMVAGHVHAYERFHPIDENGALAEDGKGITYFTLGGGGASLYKTFAAIPATSAVHDATFGHGEFTFVNATHCLYNFVNGGTDGLTDSVWIRNRY